MMKKAENIIVGISIGICIGSEVVLKTFEDSRMLELCTPIFANVKIMSFIKEFRVSFRFMELTNSNCSRKD
jgi:4-hydroxythreonine-4-phosphate dehydrogenase